jgi:hypothetical protein
MPCNLVDCHQLLEESDTLIFRVSGKNGTGIGEEKLGPGP